MQPPQLGRLFLVFDLTSGEEWFLSTRYSDMLQLLSSVQEGLTPAEQLRMPPKRVAQSLYDHEAVIQERTSAINDLMSKLIPRYASLYQRCGI